MMYEHSVVCSVLTTALLAVVGCKGDPAPAPTPAPSPGPPPAAAAETLHYTGAVELGPGAELIFTVSLTGSAGAWAGTMSIPIQGLKDGALHDVTVDDAKLAFVLRPPGAPEAAWARFTATRTPDGGSGHLSQGGQRFPLTLKATTEAGLADATPKRPQTPKPPYPYVTRDVTIPHPAANAVITGTLTAPKAPGRYPAALLITGSGAQDRDETIFGHKPFLVLADHLTRNGIVVLRVDDRGVGGSTAHPDATVQDHVTDVAAAFAFLLEQPEVDPDGAGLIGHSEGGLIAPLVAVERDDVAFIVSLAGAVLPGRELMPLQTAALSRASGLSEATVAMLVGHNRALMQAIATGKDEAAIKAVIQTSIDEARAAGIPGLPAPGADTDAFVAGQAAASASRWFRSFVTLDARPAWSRIGCPILALNGTLDTQVPHEENLGALRVALAKEGEGPYTVKALPGLNHLFQTAKTGGVDEYAQIEETLAPALLDAVTSWLDAAVGG